MNSLNRKRPRPKVFEKRIARLFFKTNRELLPEKYQIQVELPIEDFFISVNKLSIHGWKIPHPESRGTILFYHGSTGTMRSWLLLYHYLHRHKYTIWTFDYPGYGQSNFYSSFSTFLYDCETATRGIFEQEEFNSQNLILYGHSIGCFAVQNAILEVGAQPTKIVLQSPIISMKKLLSKRMPSFFISLFHINQFTLRPLFESNLFLHILVGEQDLLIPPEELKEWQNRPQTNLHIFPDYKHASFINPKPALLDPIFQ